MQSWSAGYLEERRSPPIYPAAVSVSTAECQDEGIQRYPEVSEGIPRIRSHILHSLLLFNSRWWVEEWRKTRAGKNKKQGGWVEKRRNGRLKGKRVKGCWQQMAEPGILTTVMMMMMMPMVKTMVMTLLMMMMTMTMDSNLLISNSKQ